MSKIFSLDSSDIIYIKKENKKYQKQVSQVSCVIETAYIECGCVTKTFLLLTKTLFIFANDVFTVRK